MRPVPMVDPYIHPTKRATGLLCMLAGGAGFLYALYLLLSPAWAILMGAFFLYVMGYHLYRSGRANGGRLQEAARPPIRAVGSASKAKFN